MVLSLHTSHCCENGKTMSISTAEERQLLTAFPLDRHLGCGDTLEEQGSASASAEGHSHREGQGGSDSTCDSHSRSDPETLHLGSNQYSRVAKAHDILWILWQSQARVMSIGAPTSLGSSAYFLIFPD